LTAINIGSTSALWSCSRSKVIHLSPLIQRFAQSTPAVALQGKVKHYVFVASAGAYKDNGVEPMRVEGDARKSAGHVAVEQ
jgi:hypothetical protein